MEILSHRGYWENRDERNTSEAFLRSYELGFGLETDIRDSNGQLVISHDPVEFIGANVYNTNKRPILTVSEFLEVYREFGHGLPLALNIKADGLQAKLHALLKTNAVENYFVFDMSVPDTLGYLKLGMPVYMRQSEYEPSPNLYERASGVWIDAFEGEWITAADITGHLNSGKRVCLVSPELHQRPHKPFWEQLRHWKVQSLTGITLCTDYPKEARQYFLDED